MDEETVTISRKQWEKLLEELTLLRQENEDLRRGQFIRNYSPKFFFKNRSPDNLQSPTKQKHENFNNKSDFKKRMREWSKNFASNHFESNLQVNSNALQNNSKNKIISPTSSENESVETNETLNEMKLLQAVCMFGPSSSEVQLAKGIKKSNVKSQLHFISNPKKEERYQKYSSYFYPDGEVKVKRIREEDAVTQMNKIIFKKNIKKDQCLIHIFQKDENNELLKKHNPVLEEVNPGKWLTAFCVQFNDFFTFQHDEKITQTQNLSYQEKSEGSNQPEENLTKSLKILQKKEICMIGKFTLCIFTYFPLVSLMEQILIQAIAEIKGKRIGAFGEKSRISSLSYKFFISELHQICRKLDYQINRIPTEIGSSGNINIGNSTIQIFLTKRNFVHYLYSGWAYQLLKQYDKEKLYDIFCSILMEQIVVFVSENLHILTYLIFFFTICLPTPFYYPHPIINVLFNLQFLETPYPVTAGINETSKWLKENECEFRDKIVFIDLNNKDQLTIFDSKKSKIKSQKLRKVFSRFYKKIETPIFKKKENIIKQTLREENDEVYKFIGGIKNYFQEEVFRYLPKKELIQCWHQNAEDTNESHKVLVILKQILKLIKETRKIKQIGKERDMFLEAQKGQSKDSQSQSFLDTQIFSVFLSDYYGFY